MKVVRVLSLLFGGTLVLTMLALVSSVIVGVMVAGNLWLLLPLALYACAFFVMASACMEISKLGKLERKNK